MRGNNIPELKFLGKSERLVYAFLIMVVLTGLLGTGVYIAWLLLVLIFKVLMHLRLVGLLLALLIFLLAVGVLTTFSMRFAALLRMIAGNMMFLYLERKDKRRAMEFIRAVGEPIEEQRTGEGPEGESE